jgi:hypothetical protein
MQHPVTLAPCLKPLPVGLSVNQVGKRLCTKKVNLAIGKHAVREFAWSRRPEPFSLAKPTHDGRRHR